MTKLSFIVPIFNVESYLRKCVDSLIAQDYDNYEIILVDDGSPDACPSICDEYARMNETIVRDRSRKELENEGVRELGKPFIRVIHRENGGLSAARNTGIAAAKGEYVCFVDSDDFWEPKVLGGLLAQIEREELDVLRFDYQNVRIKNERVREIENEGEYEVFEPNKYPRKVDGCSEVVDGERYLNERMEYSCYATQFIIRRDLLKNALFAEGIHFEDVDWLPRMMLNAKRVNSTTRVVYNYLHRLGSISRTRGEVSKKLKNLKDKMYIAEKYGELYTQHPACTWIRKMQSNLVVGILTMVAMDFYGDRKQYILWMQSNHVMPLLLADQGKTCNRRAKLINLLGPEVYCIAMHIMTKLRAK